MRDGQALAQGGRRSMSRVRSELDAVSNCNAADFVPPVTSVPTSSTRPTRLSSCPPFVSDVLPRSFRVGPGRDLMSGTV